MSFLHHHKSVPPLYNVCRFFQVGMNTDNANDQLNCKFHHCDMDLENKRYPLIERILVEQIQRHKYNESQMRQHLHTNRHLNMDLANKHLWLELIECILMSRFHLRCILVDKYKKCRIDFDGKLLVDGKWLDCHIESAHLMFEHNIDHRLYIQTDKDHTLMNP